jgi:hypothetical protein
MGCGIGQGSSEQLWAWLWKVMRQLLDAIWIEGRALSWWKSGMGEIEDV